MGYYLLTRITVLLFSFPIIINANDAYLGSIAESVFLEEKADSIQMIKERIHIQLSDKKPHVRCKFWIYNYGASKKIAVGFPNFHFDIPKGTGPLKNFTCKVNGKKVTNIANVCF